MTMLFPAEAAANKTLGKIVQAYLGDIVGSVPDHRNKASHTNFLVSHCI
jgi:hypothetical protein